MCIKQKQCLLPISLRVPSEARKAASRESKARARCQPGQVHWRWTAARRLGGYSLARRWRDTGR
eukprot:15430399-Alexandrium_andersonii.AAC.1